MPAGKLEHHPASGIQVPRAFLTTGLGFILLGKGRVALTGGAGGQITTITVDSVDLLSGVVAFNGTLAQTALDAAANINDNYTQHVFFAIALGDDILIYQRLAGSLSGTEADVGATFTTITADLTDITGATDTIVTIASGDPSVAFAEFYQLALDRAQWGPSGGAAIIPDEPMAHAVPVAGENVAGALKVVGIEITPENDFELCAGKVNINGNVMTGRTYTGGTKDIIPWVDGEANYIVKLSADGPWRIELVYI